MAREVVQMSAEVPKAEYDAFKDNFPQYGAVSWFINNALAQFNAQVRANPTAKRLIDRAVDDMLELNKNISIVAGSASRAEP